MALELKINEVTWNFESGTLPDQKSHKVFVALMTKDDFGYFMVTISELYHIMKMSSKIKTVEELRSVVEKVRCR